MTLPDYTPELARELRGDRTQAQMCELVGLSRSSQWSEFEYGRRTPSAQTWLLALIVSGRHPEFGPVKSGRRAGVK